MNSNHFGENFKKNDDTLQCQNENVYRNSAVCYEMRDETIESFKKIFYSLNFYVQTLNIF